MQKLSVAQLYPYALAEGEGVGTAYEYLAKRLVLTRWLGAAYVPERIAIAGLPEKYGSSLDFAIMAHEFGAELTVIDDRREALEKFENSVPQAQALDYLSGLAWRSELVNDLSFRAPKKGGHDLALSSEVLQRLGDSDQRSSDDACRAGSASRLGARSHASGGQPANRER